MIVRNISGTSQDSCECGSWQEHWKKFSGEPWRTFCCVRGCMKKAEVGAHVQKDDPTDKAWYIILVCMGHNAKASQLDVANDTILVSANVAETCGKKK
jgi:hypothetical protein